MDEARGQARPIGASQRVIQLRQRAKPSTKVLFFGMTLAGLLLHFFAVYLTRVIMVSGTGAEGNPLFYLMGSSNFVLFGFAVIGGYYFVDWVLNVPMWYKLLGATWLTGVTGFDFAHDLMYFLGYGAWPIASLAHLIH